MKKNRQFLDKPVWLGYCFSEYSASRTRLAGKTAWGAGFGGQEKEKKQETAPKWRRKSLKLLKMDAEMARAGLPAAGSERVAALKLGSTTGLIASRAQRRAFGAP